MLYDSGSEALNDLRSERVTAHDDLSKLGQGSSRKDTEQSSGPSSTAGAERSDLKVGHR